MLQLFEILPTLPELTELSLIESFNGSEMGVPDTLSPIDLHQLSTLVLVANSPTTHSLLKAIRIPHCTTLRIENQP